MLIDRDDSFLVIVDMQQKLVPAISISKNITAIVKILTSAANILNVPILITEHCPDRIGHTITDLEEAVAAGQIVAKVHFNAMAEQTCRNAVTALNRRQAIVCGTETHVCVLQTAIGLKQEGFDVRIVADAVGSRKRRDRATALKRLTGRGIEIVTAEMVIFEWLQRGDTEEFREILPLLKSL